MFGAMRGVGKADDRPPVALGGGVGVGSQLSWICLAYSLESVGGEG